MPGRNLGTGKCQSENIGHGPATADVALIHCSHFRGKQKLGPWVPWLVDLRARLRERTHQQGAIQDDGILRQLCGKECLIVEAAASSSPPSDSDLKRVVAHSFSRGEGWQQNTLITAPWSY